MIIKGRFTHIIEVIILRSTDNQTSKIGRGGYWDKIAFDAIQRKIRLENSPIFTTECGLGASGFPHIGSFADAARAYAVAKAVENQGGYETQFITYSDDLDGLRKVPVGLPDSLNEWLGVPVTKIPDPYECHSSYGRHMSLLLLESLDSAGIEYTHQSAAKLYHSGKFKRQVTTIYEHAEMIGEIIQEQTGQEKYIGRVPYHPICKNCGKIYSTRVLSFDLNTETLEYICEGTEIRNNTLDGCGYQGHNSFITDQGKLSWKVEFAARWDALQIDFEPYGKDILDSVEVNNRISKEIFNYEPPFQIRYEMYLDKGGVKISKSKGNVFTPQMWFRYGSPQSLVFMTLKRFEGSRSLGIEDIPHYMDEFDQLEAMYRGYLRIQDKKQEQLNRALYEYCWWLQVPVDPTVISDENSRYVPVSYNFLAQILRYKPVSIDDDKFIQDRLIDYDIIRDTSDWEKIKPKIEYVKQWCEDFQNDMDEVNIELDEIEKAALANLVYEFKNMDLVGEDIQSTIFHTAKHNGIKPRDMFAILYQIYIGETSGPRMWKLIEMIDGDAITKIEKAIY